MFRVITSGPFNYTGFSEKLAEEFYASAIKSGLCVLMMQRVGNKFVDVKETIQ